MLLLSRFLCAISSIIDCEVVVLLVRFTKSFCSLLFALCYIFETNSVCHFVMLNNMKMQPQKNGGHSDDEVETKYNNMVPGISRRRTYNTPHHRHICARKKIEHRKEINYNNESTLGEKDRERKKIRKCDKKIQCSTQNL